LNGLNPSNYVNLGPTTGGKGIITMPGVDPTPVSNQSPMNL